jgi:hypothetical protein
MTPANPEESWRWYASRISLFDDKRQARMRQVLREVVG